MKHFLLLPLLLFFSCTAFAQINPPQCDNDFFNLDSQKYFLINEVKPFGTDRFVELWNCRDSAYTADVLYVSGMYSGVIDSFFNKLVPAHGFLVLALPDGLFNQDGIKIVSKKDTVWNIAYQMTYIVNNPLQSIGFCDYYILMNPTPGAANDCTPTGIVPVANDDKKVLLKKYNILGQRVR